MGTTKEAQRIESIYGTLSVPYVDAIGYASKGTDGTKSADVDVVGTEQTVDAAHDQEMVADGEDESSIGVPCVQYMGHSEQQATFAPLSRADLVLATFQIWHNTPHVPPTAEWALRIDADNSEKRNGGPWVLVHHVLFKRSPRKHRYVMARYVREGKVSAEWAAKHVEQTRKLPPNTWIGLMTKQQFKDKTPPGKSGNAHWVYQGCWATLTLDAAGTKPECLTVYFGDEPVEVRQFAPSTSGDDKAPEWLGEYDPNGIRKSVTQMDRIRQNALKDRTLATHMPTNKVVARFRDQEIRLRELEAENAAMQARIDALETEKAR